MTDDTSILNRLNRLERANRRLKFVGVLACTLAGAALLMGQGKQPPRRVVEAEEFRLVEKDGTVRGEWVVQTGGTAAMNLFAGGHVVVGLAARSDGIGAVALTDGRHVSGYWTTTPGGGVGLLLYDKAGTQRGLFEVGPDGETSLTLKDKDGNLRAILGAANIVTTKTGVEIKTAESSLVLLDKESGVIWRAPR